MNRREFLAGGVAFGAGLSQMPVLRAASPTPLVATTRTIEVKSRAARVFGLMRPDGGHGLRLRAEDGFNVSLANGLAEDTLIHWHGQIPPYPLDGVPNAPAAPMKPGETRLYSFPTRAGTHWMHAHTLQEQSLLAAPLIVRTAEDDAADVQDIVVLLHDFSFKTPEELLAGLTGGRPAPVNHGAMNHAAMGHASGGMDLNDIAYDAFLANDRTLDDPEVFIVAARGRVRLRIINGASATAFSIDTGVLKATVVAVDGQPVVPVADSLFPLGMGQRLDLLVEMSAAGAFPVLALVEGLRARTGFVLATPGSRIAKLSSEGTKAAPVVGLDLEARLRAVTPLPPREADRTVTVLLKGTMAPYAWTMEGTDALKVRSGERVEIVLRNVSDMAHPMHSHGHSFQVTGINGAALAGALRDTVVVPGRSDVRIVFDAGQSGRWAFHCHHLYHMMTGMMSFIAVA